VGQQGSFGESTEMYLKTIAELANERDPVPVTSVADRLGISTVSASEMIHRLEARKFVRHRPYKGVYLTEVGRREANGVIRRQRLWECFLTDELGIPWEKVHDFACRLEHATDPMVTEALADFLNHPTTCPHGNPIPTADGEMPPLEGAPLDDLKQGEKGIILRIHPVSKELVKHLDERGFSPGRKIEVTEIAPFNGPMSIKVEDQIHVIGREVAAHVMIQQSVINREE
jgi:DtxR family Mn-dependent transcriptional regulator